MKTILLLILCHLSFSLFCQVVIGKPWKVQCGASTSNVFETSPAYNLRYISPRFNWSNEDLTVEEEKDPEKFKKMRLMVELIYTPPLKVLCTGLNVQYRLLKYKRLSLEVVGGLKFFFVPGPDFETITPLQRGKGDIWYMNIGLIAQVNLGIMTPFADFGGDGIITIGSEFNFHALHRKPKKRYKLHAKTVEQ